MHDYIEAFSRVAYVFWHIDQMHKPWQRQCAIFASVMVWREFLHLAASHQFGRSWRACCDSLFGFVNKIHRSIQQYDLDFQIATLKTERHACAFDSRSRRRLLNVWVARWIQLCVVMSYGEIWIMSVRRISTMFLMVCGYRLRQKEYGEACCILFHRIIRDRNVWQMSGA